MMSSVPPQKPTDSPWLWLAVFLVGSVIALFLTMPKYAWRQPQIERQFQARERSGHSISAAGGLTPYSKTGHAMLTLRPLVRLMTAAIVVSTVVFWGSRFVKRRKDGQKSPSRDSSPTESAP